MPIIAPRCGFFPAERREIFLMTFRFAPLSSGVLFGLALCLLPAFPAGAGGQSSPDALVAKMENLYIGAKSFQGKITTRRIGKTPKGKAFAMTETREVRFRAPNQIYDAQHYVGTGEAARMSNQSVLYVGDGKSLYVYKPSLKQYVKRPSSPTVTMTQIMMRYLVNPSRFTFSMGPTAKVNGRDAYVVIGKPKIPEQMPSNVKKEEWPRILEDIKHQRPTQVFIDKRNYQLLRISGGSNRVSDEIIFGSQTINGAISDRAFAFYAPAGAKLITPPAGGAPAPMPNSIK